MHITSLIVGISFAASTLLTIAHADNHPDLKTHAITENIHVITGDGGNITVVNDDRGLLVIDDGLSTKAEELMMTLSDIADKPVKYLLNTHWHYDHVGGNNTVVADGATIFAHNNVHTRMLKGGTIAAFGAEIAPAKPHELPVITYQDGLRFHWGSDIFDVQHVPAGHTDGDSIVFVENANVVIMGDIYFHSIYPFIDASSGGSVSGVIQAVNKVLAQINDDTIVIPGHGGATAKKADLAHYRDMLVSVQTALSDMKKQGKSVDEAVAAKPTAQFDAEFNDGFLKADTWVKVVYDAI